MAKKAKSRTFDEILDEICIFDEQKMVFWRQNPLHLRIIQEVDVQSITIQFCTSNYDYKVTQKLLLAYNHVSAINQISFYQFLGNTVSSICNEHINECHEIMTVWHNAVMTRALDLKCRRFKCYHHFTMA